MRATVVEVLTANGMDTVKAGEIADVLSMGRWTHDYPITFEEAQPLGLPVSTGLPLEIYQLMELYPQAGQRRPSVESIPLPYPLKESDRRPSS